MKDLTSKLANGQERIKLRFLHLFKVIRKTKNGYRTEYITEKTKNMLQKLILNFGSDLDFVEKHPSVDTLSVYRIINDEKLMEFLSKFMDVENKMKVYDFEKKYYNEEDGNLKSPNQIK